VGMQSAHFLRFVHFGSFVDLKRLCSGFFVIKMGDQMCQTSLLLKVNLLRVLIFMLCENHTKYKIVDQVCCQRHFKILWSTINTSEFSRNNFLIMNVLLGTT